MPSGATHDRITLWTLPWVSVTTYALTRNGELTLILAGGFLFSGLMFGPDLDIRSIQYKRWGWLKGIWIPYRALLRHRSWFSHGPIVGTCGRIFYLLVFTALIAIFAVAIAQSIWGFSWNWYDFIWSKYDLLTHQYLQESVALFLGLELGAMSHSISDLIGSYHKKYLTSKGLKRKQLQGRKEKSVTTVRKSRKVQR